MFPCFMRLPLLYFPSLVSKISIRKTELPILGQVNYVLSTRAKWRLLVLSIPDLKYQSVERSLWKLAFLWVSRVNTIKKWRGDRMHSFPLLPYFGRTGPISGISSDLLGRFWDIFGKSLAKFWAGEKALCSGDICTHQYDVFGRNPARLPFPKISSPPATCL